MLLTEQILRELNIHLFVAKSSSTPITNENQGTLQQTNQKQHTPDVILNKNQFRLLVKMLQAIDHQFDQNQLSHIGKNIIRYSMTNKVLIFDDVHNPDTNNEIHLSNLDDMISQPQLKRPVWEKLKKLRNTP